MVTSFFGVLNMFTAAVSGKRFCKLDDMNGDCENAYADPGHHSHFGKKFQMLLGNI